MNDDILTPEKLRKMVAEVYQPRSLLADDQNWNGRFMRNPHMTVPKSRLRTWRERFFTRPWCPWKPVQMWQVPDPNVYVANVPNLNLFNYKTKDTRKMIVGHPDTITKIEKALCNDH